MANLLLRQPRVQPSSASHHSSTRASKDFHHYERIKLASGRKPHSHARNPHHQHHHHHHHHQQYASQVAGSTGKQLKPAATGVAVEAGLAVTQTDAAGHQNHDQVSSTTSQDSENAKTQRNTQAALADDRGVGAGGMGGTGDAGGSAKRQKISEKESNGQPVRHQATAQSTETAAGGAAEPSLPPRNIIRTAPTGSNPSYVTPHSSGSQPQVGASSTTTVITTNSSNHQQQQQQSSSSSGDASSVDTSLPASSTSQQLSAEDVLMHCMLQMAQAQAVNPAPNSGPSTAPASWPSSDATAGVVTTTADPTSATTSAPSSSSSSSGGTPHNLKPGKAGALESPNSMFSRGNFASLDHLSALSQPVGVATSPVSTQPHSASPKFHARGKTATITGTATTMTSSSSSNSSSSAPSTLPTPSTAFSNADITRLIPHLEAIAGSLQNTPSLESHCLAALAQSQLLPALAQYDPDTPQTAQLPDSLQNVPLVAPGLSSDGKQLLLPNSATIDPATLLANLDMNTLMQNLASPELQASDLSPDIHTQPVYPADFSSLKRLSQKMQAAAVAQSSSSSLDRASGGGGGGHQLEADLLQSRARPLTASFLLDHNFPMDIPPPTDLLPEHVSSL